MTYGKRAISLALAAVLLAGSLAGTPAEAAEQHDVLWLDSYDVLYSFSCGYAYVEKEDDRCLIDPAGAQLEIDPAYECIGPFRNGLAPVRRAGQDDPLYHVQTIGWIGLDGELALPLEYYDTADASFQRNVLFTTRSDGRAVTLGANGQEIAVAPATIHLTDLPWANLNGLVPVYVARPNGPATLGFADQNWEEGETGQTILPASADLTGYADANQVSPWAADSMAALTAAGLLQDTSATTLSPKDTTTVEQGILLALRAWQAFMG